jgi:hypothetical protein
MQICKLSFVYLVLISILVSACEPPEITVDENTQDVIDILSTLSKMDIDFATTENLVIKEGEDKIPQMYHDSVTGILEVTRFLDNQNIVVPTDDVMPIAMRLLNDEYLYLVLGSEITPEDTNASFSFPVPHNSQKHFLVRLTDGAMFRFDAQKYNVLIRNEYSGVWLYGNKSLNVNDSNIYFISGAESPSSYGETPDEDLVVGGALYKVDTTDPNNLTAARLSFINDSVYAYVADKDGKIVYGGSGGVRYTTANENGYVDLEKATVYEYNVAPSFICPDNTIYSRPVSLGYSAVDIYNSRYTIDVSEASVISQTPPVLTLLSPNPFVFVDSNGLKDGYDPIVQYTIYNTDGTYKYTLGINNSASIWNDSASIWKICGGSHPERLYAGPDKLSTYTISDNTLYLFGDGELHYYDLQNNVGDIYKSTLCPNCTWGGFTITAPNEFVLRGSDASRAISEISIKVSDSVETLLDSQVDIIPVQQIERIF